MNHETGADYIIRVASESTLMGERGRIAWTSIAGLVTAADLREAVKRGAVRVEDVTLHGRTVKHIVSVKGER